jgi:hypothetical protein
MAVRRHGIAHVTLQMECEGCEPDRLYCDPNGWNHAYGKRGGGPEGHSGTGPA